MHDKKAPLIIKSNEFDYSFSITEMEAADLIQTAPFKFNLIHNSRSVNATIIEADMATKKFTVEIAGEKFSISIKDELDQVLEKMGFGVTSNRHIKEIKAPMPGKVLEIAVSEGQAVMEGDKMIILEAMKMENSIVIHTAAIIKKISITAGQIVEKGQVLIELE